MYRVPVSEQETVIQIDRSGDVAVIWTSDQVMMNKIDKLVENEDSPWKLTDVGYFNEDGVRTVATKEYECPKNLISFRSKKVVRELTEEQKQKGAESLRLYREKKKLNSQEDN